MGPPLPTLASSTRKENVCVSAVSPNVSLSPSSTHSAASFILESLHTPLSKLQKFFSLSPSREALFFLNHSVLHPPFSYPLERPVSPDTINSYLPPPGGVGLTSQSPFPPEMASCASPPGFGFSNDLENLLEHLFPLIRFPTSDEFLPDFPPPLLHKKTEGY